VLRFVNSALNDMLNDMLKDQINADCVRP
jgi:hypothetical protein